MAIKHEGHEAIDADDAYNRGQNRAENLARDLKVTQIHDQPGKGKRVPRTITKKAPK
jgi:hypothetical protein